MRSLLLSARVLLQISHSSPSTVWVHCPVMLTSPRHLGRDGTRLLRWRWIVRLTLVSLGKYPRNSEGRLWASSLFIMEEGASCEDSELERIVQTDFWTTVCARSGAWECSLTLTISLLLVTARPLHERSSHFQYSLSPFFSIMMISKTTIT